MVFLAVLWIVPVFIAAPIWRMFFHGNNGVSLFSTLTGLEVNLLVDPISSFLTVLFAATVHSLPPVVVVIYAGLKKTPRDLADAARVEGAGELQLFRYVYLPMIRPFLFLLLVVTLIKGFQEFTVPYLMTAGGPPVLGGITDAYVVGATTTLEVYLYDLFRFSGSMAVPAAYSTAFLFLFGAVAGVWYLLRRRFRARPVLIPTTAVLVLLFDGPILAPSIPGIGVALVLLAGLRVRPAALIGSVGLVTLVAARVGTAGALQGLQPAVVPALGVLAAELGRYTGHTGGRPGASLLAGVADAGWRAWGWVSAMAFAVTTLVFVYLLGWISMSAVDSVFVDAVVPPFAGLQNYAALFGNSGFLRALANSVVLSAGTAAVATLVAFLAAAATVVYRRDGSRVFLGAQFFQLTGGIHSLVPLFALVVFVGLVDSYLPIIVLYAASALPVGFYVIYAFLHRLPESLWDAARIAGAGHGSYIVQILLPLSRPALVNVVLLAWITAWNGFLIPLIFLTEDSRFPVSIFLHNLVGTIASGTPSWGVFAAASVVNIALLSVLFVASRRPLQYDAVSELI
jgi:ABC-type glycerol-3-phosphate transport system permease component